MQRTSNGGRGLVGLEQPAAAPAALAMLFTRNKSAVAWSRLVGFMDGGASREDTRNFQFKERTHTHTNTAWIDR